MILGRVLMCRSIRRAVDPGILARDRRVEDVLDGNADLADDRACRFELRAGRYVRRPGAHRGFLGQ